MGWAFWLRAWINRIELVALAEPWVQELGLRWLPEGWKAEVSAEGSVDGRALCLRWKWSFFGIKLMVRLGNRWEEVPMEGGLDGLKAVLARR
jgi:hypothetical protein